MRRLTTLLIGVVAIVAIAAVSAAPAAAKPRGNNGKIVTNSDNLVTGEEQVYTVDPDGTDEQLVYNNSEVGQWSPDGTRIAFSTNRAGGNFDIWVMRADGSDLRRLTAAEGTDINPEWSPDGRMIAFTSARDGNLEIYVMAADGTAQTDITDSPSDDFSPTWR